MIRVEFIYKKDTITQTTRVNFDSNDNISFRVVYEPGLNDLLVPFSLRLINWDLKKYSLYGLISYDYGLQYLTQCKVYEDDVLYKVYNIDNPMFIAESSFKPSQYDERKLAEQFMAHIISTEEV